MLKSLVDSLDNKKNLPTISPCLNISPSSSLSSSSFSNSSRQSASFTSTSTDKSSDSSFKNLKITSNDCNSKKLEKIEETSSSNKSHVKIVKTKKFSFGFGKKLRNFLSSDKNRSNKSNTNVSKVETIDKKVINLNELKIKTKNIEEIRLNLQNKLK
jgi:hypothetical protein